MSRSSARKIVAEIEEGTIREKIALFDWLVSRKDPRVQKSPAGFLYRSITEDFSLPADYTKSLGKPATSVRNIVPLQRQKPNKEEKPKPASDREAIEHYWNSLGLEDQERIERELVTRAPRFHREQYLAGQKERGVLFAHGACRPLILAQNPLCESPCPSYLSRR